ncbi:hypothetical protein [Vibrio sp. 10N.247.311.51]|uniref:hypothetical protein n=1 Tax=Vibrio sp. 10N.247.311.51 TaxID=3229996 RepID=UPI00354F9B7D
MQSTYLVTQSVFLFSCLISLHPYLPFISYAFKHQYSSTDHLFEKIVLTMRLSALTYVILSILLLASNKHVMQQNNNEGR